MERSGRYTIFLSLKYFSGFSANSSFPPISCQKYVILKFILARKYQILKLFML
jgi:hypothetical protein